MFSQGDEEQHILDFFGSRVGTFLDIGAYDGISLSNTRALSLRGWSGLLVEPDPKAFLVLSDLAKQNPRLHLVNAAVTGKREVRLFHSLTVWGGTLSDDLAKVAQVYRLIDYHILTMSPDDIADIRDELGLTFNFVSLDAEWVDHEILEHMGRLLEGTELLCVEFRDPQYTDGSPDPIPDLCAQLGFGRLVAKTGVNLLCARNQ